MALLARKFDSDMWQSDEKSTIEDLPADTITGCLRTKKNTLSVYLIDSTDDLDEAVLALATHPQRQNLDALHFVLLTPEILNQKDLELKQTDGDTIVQDLKETHHDIINLTYAKLGIVGGIILTEIQSGKVTSISASNIAKIIRTAIDKKRLKFKQFHRKFKEVLTERFLQLGCPMN